MQAERKGRRGLALFNQEYMRLERCDTQRLLLIDPCWTGEGRANRKCAVGSQYEVYTSWDWALETQRLSGFQFIGKEVRVIDYYESSGVGFGHYVKYCAKPLRRASLLPHDVRAELSTPRITRKTLGKLGIRCKVAGHIG